MNLSDRIKLILIFAVISLCVYSLFKLPLRLGLDLKGGSHIIFKALDSPLRKVDHDSVSGVISVIRNRLDSAGFNEATIAKKREDQIVVELPGVNDPERALNLIGQTALLEFVEAEWSSPALEKLSSEEQAELIGEGFRLDTYIQYDAQNNEIGSRPILLGRTLLTGSDLNIAKPGTSEMGEPLVLIEFNSEGRKKFFQATQQQIGKPLAILLDGKIISAPTVNEPIPGGNAQITGGFSINEMRDLVIKLKAGALPVPITVISNRTIGPVLGQESIDKSLRAGLIGLSIVAVFMLFVYRVFGIVSFSALVLYILFVLGFIKLLGVILTLPGIAGIILSVGMAVDANIIIFERIKEEYRNNRELKKALSYGFSKAFLAIIDANITTLIAAIILFWLGTGSIKGFAVTLSIGILVSMFTAIFISRLLILMLYSTFNVSFGLKEVKS